MYLGYHAHSLVDHYLADAVGLLSDLGYGGVILPLSSSRLSPRTFTTEAIKRMAFELDQARTTHSVQFILDTSTPFVLSRVEPRELNLLETDDSLWEESLFQLRWAFEFARSLGGGPVLIRSGQWNDSAEKGLERMAKRLEEIVPLAQRVEVTLALRPTVGDFISTIASFERLMQWYDSPHLAVVADTATMFSQMELPLSNSFERVIDRLCAVILRQPIARGPGENWIDQGSVSPQAVIECLKELKFAGGLFVDSLPAGPRVVETARLISQRLLPWIR